MVTLKNLLTEYYDATGIIVCHDGDGSAPKEGQFEYFDETYREELIKKYGNLEMEEYSGRSLDDVPYSYRSEWVEEAENLEIRFCF